MAYAIALDAWIAAHEAVMDLIFTGSDVATITIYDDDDIKLTEATLDSATSEVSAITGTLTLAILDQDASADASGTASYALIVKADGDPIMELPCAEGTVSAGGTCVMNTLEVVAASPTYVASLTIPAGATL